MPPGDVSGNQPQKQQKTVTKCKQCEKFKICKMSLMELDDKLQYYVRELLLKEGRVLFLQQQSERQSKENQELKQRVETLEKELQEEKEKNKEGKRENKKESKYLRQSLKGKIQAQVKDGHNRKSKAKLLVKKDQLNQSSRSFEEAPGKNIDNL